MADIKAGKAELNKNITSETTVVAGEATLNQTTGRGEIAIDSGATAANLQEQTVEERLGAAREEALVNHDAEHVGDDKSYEETISRDKEDK